METIDDLIAAGLTDADALKRAHFPGRGKRRVHHSTSETSAT